MAERKPVSKKMRFEVFKRDSFQCQYCGRSAPDVILEVDHLTPVSAGGKNSMVNLITSCRDCNRGKGKTLLCDTAEIQKQKAELDRLNERREQIEMMAKWRAELVQIEEKEIDMISSLFLHSVGKPLATAGRTLVMRVIREFGFNEAFCAAEIAIRHYCRSNEPDELIQDANYAVSKIGGICSNRRRNGDHGY